MSVVELDAGGTMTISKKIGLKSLGQSLSLLFEFSLELWIFLKPRRWTQKNG